MPRALSRNAGGSLALLGLSFALYAALASRFWGGLPFGRIVVDLLYDADMQIVGAGGANGFANLRHPLFAALTGPVFATAHWLTGSVRWSVLGPCALAGAFCVLLVHRVLLAIPLASRDALLFSVLFALSPSQLLFSVMPETFIFSLAGLLSLFAINAVVRSDRLHLALFVPALALAAGLNLVNLVFGVALFLGRRRNDPSKRTGIALAILLAGTTACMAAVFAAQSDCAPRAALDHMLWDDNTPRYLEKGIRGPQKPWESAWQLAPYLTVYSLAAPALVETKVWDSYIAIRSSTRIASLPAASQVAGAISIAWVIGIAAWAAARRKRAVLYSAGAFRVLLMDLFLFSVYRVPDAGDLFLFSTFFTAPWLLILAHVVAERPGDETGRPRPLGAVWWGIALLLAAYNLYWLEVTGVLFRVWSAMV